MLDYDEYTHLGTGNEYTRLGTEESSPEALFFGSSTKNSSRFDSAQGSPETFETFGGLSGKKSSSEFDPDGDSPGIGSEMRGLRLNSRFPSPVQGTVRLEDVMLPQETGEMDIIPPAPVFEEKPQLVEHTLYQAYFSVWWVDSSPPYNLALVGIPPNGAKSRVETQIKLDLQLLDPETEEPVNTYDYIKLPAYGVSKEKFRLGNLKGTAISFLPNAN
jgi:hypothetical protein